MKKQFSYFVRSLFGFLLGYKEIHNSGKLTLYEWIALVFLMLFILIAFITFG